MLVLFPSKKHKKYVHSYRLCNDFLNSLEEKITAHYGTIYLISFTKDIFLYNLYFNEKNLYYFYSCQFFDVSIEN